MMTSLEYVPRNSQRVEVYDGSSTEQVGFMLRLVYNGSPQWKWFQNEGIRLSVQDVTEISTVMRSLEEDEKYDSQKMHSILQQIYDVALNKATIVSEDDWEKGYSKAGKEIVEKLEKYFPQLKERLEIEIAR